MWRKIKDFFFHNRTTRQTVAKNTFWLAISNVGGRLLRSIIIIYSARVLGAAEWGLFSYAVSFVAFITIFTDIGINSLLQRETAKTKDVSFRHSILSTSFVLKIFLLALGVIVMMFIAPHLTNLEGVKPLFPIVTLVLVFDSLQQFGFSIVRASEKMELEAGLFLLTNAAIVAFGFFFLHLSHNVKIFTLSYAVGDGLGMLATVYVLRYNIRGLLSYFSFSRLKSILESAWPFAISMILGIIMINSDILIIGWLRSIKDVGLYSAAQRIVSLIYVLPSIISASLLPSLARFAHTDNKKFREILEKIMGMSFLVSLPIAAGGLILGKEIIIFVFGGGYAEGALSFQILIATVLVDFTAAILSSAVFAYNRQKNLTIYSSIGAIFNIIFDLIFIPIFGIAGSAFSTFLAQTISNAYLWRVMKGINPFRVMPRLRKIIISSLIMSVFVGAAGMAGLPLLIVISSAIVVYFGALLLLGENLIEEIKLTLRPAASTEQANGA